MILESHLMITIAYKKFLVNDKSQVHQCVTFKTRKLDHLLLVVIAGNAPKAEFTDLAYKRIEEFESSNN